MLGMNVLKLRLTLGKFSTKFRDPQLKKPCVRRFCESLKVFFLETCYSTRQWAWSGRLVEN